jgi:hypothetical protein
MLLAVTALSSVAVNNGALNFLALIVLWLGIRLLWRPQFSPVFFFIFCYSWIQASIRVFQANILNIEINQLPVMGGDIYLASALSLLGIAVLAIGMRFGLGHASSSWRSEFVGELENRPPLFWFRCYAVALLIALALEISTFVAPGLSQPIIALANLKWAFFWLFTHIAFVKGGISRWLWLLVFLLEFLMGVAGFFSSFKTVVFFTILGLISSGIRLSGWRIAALAGLSALLVTVGVAWTAIKAEQRSFLNQGNASQEVLVGFQDSVGNIFNLASNLNATVMADSFMVLVDRITYVELFGEVLDIVPSQMPYEKGALWGDAILRPFMPRLFFPEKSIIDESLRTSEYTRREFAGIDQGTQVSLGYIADSYIDFGPLLMMLPILAVGWFMGRFYRWIINLQWCRGAIGAGMGTATVFQMSSIEISNTKLFGGLIVGMLMSWLVAMLIVPMFYSPEKPAVLRARVRRG